MKQSSLTPALEETLRKQQIDALDPGPILHDFEVFLEFIANNHIVASPKNNLLPQSSLATLNSRLAKPLEIRLKRPIQKSYPHLNGLYLLGRASGLMRIMTLGKKAVLALEGPATDAWGELNRTEQYFALLEVWFEKASIEMLGEPGEWRSSGMLSECLNLWRRISKKGLKFGRSEQEYLMHWAHNIALMEMFGLAQIKRGKPQVDKGWMIERIDWTAFGEALMTLINSTYTVGSTQ